MGKYFGTDGFRGEANVTLTSMHAYRIGRFLGKYLGDKKENGEGARVVIGKDTRRSSYMLEYSIAAGIAASGTDVYMLHVITTPGVSYVTRTDGFDAGIMITASHNPYYDNGIKILNSDGEKLEDSVTDMIEEYIDGGDIEYATGKDIGRIVDYVSGRNRYIGHLISLASCSYKDLRIGLDTANGASFEIARSVFSALGAKVEQIGASPNGTNVNDACGSTHIDALSSLVKEKKLDVGFAFDGDADRCIAVDSDGRVIDGDGIMFVLAKRLLRLGILTENKIAATVMSNSGFVESLRRIGISTDITKVGDRYVYERMQKEGYALGGEQSGHIIIRKYAQTGDGILTALMLCEELCDTSLTLTELTRDLTLYPQYGTSVRVRDKDSVLCAEGVRNTVKKIESQIRKEGRVLLRKSGTEPVIRIMVECESEEDARLYTEMIKEKIWEYERAEE